LYVQRVLQNAGTRGVLEAASFSQGSVLNVSNVARECHVERRVVDFSGLRAFLRAYPMAKACLIYGGARENHEDGVRVMPMGECLRLLPGLL
jgi:hypothetical protein